MKVKVIFDCVVFVQAAIKPSGPASRCLEIIKLKNINLVFSRETLKELSEVLLRPALVKRYPILTVEYVSDFILKLETQAILYDPVPKLFYYPRDPKDEPYINLAIAAGANYLVSRDLDLLDLMQDSHFRQSYPDITICDPVQFLTVLNALP